MPKTLYKSCFSKNENIFYQHEYRSFLGAGKKIRIKFLTTDNTDNIPTSWLTAHRQLADKIPTRF